MHKMTQLFSLAGLTLLLSACGGPSDYTPGPDMTAADIYVGACQECHGENGAGKFGFLFKIAGSQASVDEIAEILKNGGKIMPSFPKMSDEQRMAMAAYIKAL